jgi:hypothetical protein
MNTLELYKTLDFKHDEITRTSAVVIWWKPDKTLCPVPSENIITLSIPYTSYDPSTMYRSPSASHIVDKDGIGLYEPRQFNSRIQLPLGVRACYQCEYDEWAYKVNENVDINDMHEKDVVNYQVWKAVLHKVKND